MPKQEEMEVWTENEGPSSDEEEEVPADQSLRGQCALVTAACPRKYPRELAGRKAQGLMLPEDYSKEQFLANLRLIIGRHCTARVEKASRLVVLSFSQPANRIESKVFFSKTRGLMKSACRVAGRAGVLHIR